MGSRISLTFAACWRSTARGSGPDNPGDGRPGRQAAARSDDDFIARFAPTAPAEAGSLGRRLVGLAEGLEATLGARVDLISDAPIRNRDLREAIDASRRVIHGRAAEQASA